MKIIITCIYLTLVAGTRDHCNHASNNYLQLFGVQDNGRMVRSGAGGGSSGVSGFYIPANSGGGNSFKSWSAGANQGGSANAFNLLGDGSGSAHNSMMAGNYGTPGTGGGAGHSSKLGGGGSTGSNSQGWIPIVGTGASSLPGPIGGGASGDFGLQVGNAVAGTYSAPSTSTRVGGLGNQGGNVHTGGNNYKDWNSNIGVTGLPGRNGGTGGYSLSVRSTGTETHGPPSTGTSMDGESNQGEDGNARGSNLQGWNSNQSGNGGGSVAGLPGPIGSASGYSLQAGSAESYGLKSTNAGAGGVSNQSGDGGAGGSNFQDWNSNQSDNQGSSVSDLPGPIGSASGFSLQVNRAVRYGPKSTKAGGVGRGSSQRYSASGNQGARGRSKESTNFGDYQEVPVDYQTSEGRNVDPQLLEQIRAILYQEEVSSGSYEGHMPSGSAPSMSYGVPSSAYGAPGGSGGGRSGRIVGIVIEGIDQSIQIAQFHQMSSSLTGDIFSKTTMAIPSGSYGAP